MTCCPVCNEPITSSKMLCITCINIICANCYCQFEKCCCPLCRGELINPRVIKSLYTMFKEYESEICVEQNGECSDTYLPTSDGEITCTKHINCETSSLISSSVDE